MSTEALKAQLTERQKALEVEHVQAEMRVMPQSNAEAALLRMETVLRDTMPDDASDEEARRFTLTIYELIRSNPKLVQCGTTVLGGVLTAAQLGLELGTPALGEAYLLPFKKRKNVDGKWIDTFQAQLIIGYKGYRKLAYNSGVIKSMSRHIVYENDHFRIQYGTNEVLEHSPADEPRGEVKGYYATVVNTMGGVMFKYMSKAEMERHRDAYAMSRDYKTQEISGPWRDNFNEMALKTVLLKVLRDSPMSSVNRMSIAFAVDGTVRDNTDSKDSQLLKVTKHTDIAGALTGGDDVPSTGDFEQPEQDAPALEGETLDPAPRRGATKPITPATPEQMTEIRRLCDEQGELPSLIIASILSLPEEPEDIDRITMAQADEVLAALNGSK